MGDDLVTALAERLSMTLARQATALEQINRTEWEAIAREALAFVAERLPTREAVAEATCSLRLPMPPEMTDLADARAAGAEGG